MEQKTHDILLELKNGKDAQTAAWLSHPEDYDVLVGSVEIAAQSAGQRGSIGQTLTKLYEDGLVPEEFISSDETDEDSYTNYLSTVLRDFAEQVTEYTANAADGRPIIYAPPLPIDTQASKSLASCFNSCRWLVSIDAYKGSAYDADIARLNSATNCSDMFRDCTSLVSIPERWTFNSVVNANYLFNGCISLTKLPDGFSGNTITDGTGLFYKCYALRSLPQGFTMANSSSSQAFRLCKNLESLPSGFDLGMSTAFLQTFLRCEKLQSLPSSLTFKMSKINNAQSQGEYSTDSQYNSIYQMFAEMGASSIDNEFVIDPTVQGYTGGIKFDLILWHNGFQKLSPASVASLLHCLYDYATNDPTYTNRIPSGCTNGNRLSPTVVVFSAMKTALDAIFMEKHGMDVSVYLGGIGWTISFV